MQGSYRAVQDRRQGAGPGQCAVAVVVVGFSDPVPSARPRPFQRRLLDHPEGATGIAGQATPSSAGRAEPRARPLASRPGPFRSPIAPQEALGGLTGDLLVEQLDSPAVARRAPSPRAAPPLTPASQRTPIPRPAKPSSAVWMRRRYAEERQSVAETWQRPITVDAAMQGGHAEQPDLALPRGPPPSGRCRADRRIRSGVAPHAVTFCDRVAVSPGSPHDRQRADPDPDGLQHEDRRKIEQPAESGMLAEPCRSILAESSRWISK